jgi:cyclophilin family peptidyl-prolyl cis-trans isomerase
MRKLLATLLLAPALLAAGKPKVEITTTLGAFVVELEPKAAPATVDNFLKYVRKGQYNGTIFHRVKQGGPAIIQGGGHLPNLAKKPTDGPIKCEADLAKAAGLSNTRGTIAMARESLPDSAKAQFFINTKANPDLDFKSRSLSGFGYCVFGRVVKGMDVVAKIGRVKTGTAGGMADVPLTPVVIQSAREVQ